MWWCRTWETINSKWKHDLKPDESRRLSTHQHNDSSEHVLSLSIPGLMHTSFRVTGVLSDLVVGHSTGPCALGSVRGVGVAPGSPDLGAEPPAIGYRQPSAAGPGADLRGGRCRRCGRFIDFDDADRDG